MKNRVKVFFNIPTSAGVEKEAIWTIPKNGYYEVDNIPFYVTSIALGDIVDIEEIHGNFEAKNLLKASGNSTIRLWFYERELIQTTRQRFKDVGCDSEISDLDGLISVNIPKSVDYTYFKKILDDGEADGKWDYEEACLGFV